MDTEVASVTMNEGYNLVKVANFAVALAIIGAAVLSVFYIFVGGISFILSSGQEDKIKQAVQTIRYAIIGLVVTILAVGIIKVVEAIIGIELTSYLTWDSISGNIKLIIERLTGDGDTGTTNNNVGL